jgi:WD40 repeat protein
MKLSVPQIETKKSGFPHFTFPLLLFIIMKVSAGILKDWNIKYIIRNCIISKRRLRMKSTVKILICLSFFMCLNKGKDDTVMAQENNGRAAVLSYLDNTNPKYHELEFILADNYSNNEDSISARDYYLKAMEFYNKMEYEKAIDNFILACKSYDFPVVYYQLGLCLMDAGNYSSARTAFSKSIALAPRYYYYDDRMDSGADLYTHDNKGIRREGYFAYYNIACIESLIGNINIAYDYLTLAVLHGYPYIDHIRNDNDLNNLFTYNDGGYLKAIERLYDSVRQNQVAGRGYVRHEPQGGFDEYYFEDEDSIIAYWFGGGITHSNWIFADYEIKGNMIFVKNINYHSDPDELYYDGFNKKDFTVSLDELLNTYKIVPGRTRNEILGNQNHFFTYMLFNTIEGEDGAMAYSPNGINFAIAATSQGTRNSIRIFKTATGNLVYTIPSYGYQAGICYSPNSQYIVSAGWDGTVRVWDASTGGLYKSLSLWDGTANAHTESVRTVAYSPDGRLIASGSNDYTIKIWDTTSWDVLFTLKKKHGVVNHVNFSPDGKYLVSASSDYSIGIWDVSNGKLLRTMEATHPVNTAIYSPDGKYVAAGYDDSDNKIRIWDATTGELIHIIDSGRTWQVAYSPDGKYLLAATTDSRAGEGGIKIYDTQTWDFITLTNESSQYAAFSPDGKYIVSGGPSIKLWRVYQMQK